MAAIATPPIQSDYIVSQEKNVHKILCERTAQNSAAFLLPHIKANHKILDVGCGPGSITADFAALVPHGSVIGLDASDEALSTAREEASRRGLSNIEFVMGDAARLPFDDNTFDIAYSHQILVHSRTPTTVMSEIHRVLKPTGHYGAREGDISTLIMTPDTFPLCRRSWELMGLALTKNGSNPMGGRLIQDWAVAAGFAKEKVTRTESWMEVDTDSDSQMWSLERKGPMVTVILEMGAAGKEELRGIEAEWRRFREVPVGERGFRLFCGEVVCVK